MKRIGIIGGGLGALAAAVRLRSAGHEVLLFEKNEEVGGKVARWRHDGFTFDLGPTVLAMPFVLRDLFESCGRELESYLRLHRVEPTCRYHWSDGTRFDAWSDPVRLDEELRRVFPADAPAARRFLDEIAVLYEATKDVFLFNRFRGAREFLRPGNFRMLPALPKLGITATVERSLRKRFTSEQLIQFFARFATYNGSSPYRAPAVLNVIPHVELAFGAWYPEGGMAAVADAVARLAREVGVDLRTSCEAERLERSGNRITAIVAAGERHRVDAVISNADVLWTYRSLLEPIGVRTPKSVVGAERSCSGFLVLLGVRGAHPELAHHNIFFSDDYPDEFRDIFERRRLPRAMTIYLSIASRTDRALAPEGCEPWYLLMNAPAAGIDHTDAAAAEAFTGSVLARLAMFGVRPEIVWRGGLKPIDIERRYNSVGGAIYGASSNSIFSAFLRPRNKAPGLGNLYFCGGSTHPGGGIPLVLSSGAITAAMVDRDMRA